MPGTTPNAGPGTEHAYVQPNPAGLQASAGTAPGQQGGGISSTLGNMAGNMFSGAQTPQGLAGILTNPLLKGGVQTAMQFGGAPLMLGGANAILHGGHDIGKILEGPVGSGNV